MTDDDDWVGEPPEGRHTRDRANPGFWSQNQRALTYVYFGIFVGALVVLALVLLG
jgi:hypothetical protein